MADNVLQKQPAARGPGRRFVKGQSGNPAGRPPGSRNRATIVAETLLDNASEAITQKIIERALGGDVVAQKVCLDLILPRRRDRPITVELPQVNSATDLADATSALLDAIASGALTPAEGQVVLTAYSTARLIFETSDFE